MGSLFAFDFDNGFPAEVEEAILALAQNVVQPSGDMTGATDHAAILARLTLTGGAVLAPGLWINAPIPLSSGHAIRGVNGMDQGNPHLNLAPASNCHMVTLDGTAARGYLVEGLVLDGHREDQGDGAWDGINLTGPVHAATFGQCALGRVHNVVVQFVKRHGLYMDDHQVEARVTDFYGFSCGVSSVRATGSDLWFERITSGESGGDGIVIDATDYRLSAWKAWWSGRQNAVRSDSNPPTVGEGTARGAVLSGSGIIDGGSCQDNSGPGVYLSLESGSATIWLDGNAVGLPAEYQLNANVGGCSDADLTLLVGHTSGHTVTTYPLAIAEATVRSQVRVFAGPGAVHPTQARPGSVVDPSTVLTFGPLSPSSEGGGGGGTVEETAVIDVRSWVTNTTIPDVGADGLPNVFTAYRIGSRLCVVEYDGQCPSDVSYVVLGNVPVEWRPKDAATEAGSKPTDDYNDASLRLNPDGTGRIGGGGRRRGTLVYTRATP